MKKSISVFEKYAHEYDLITNAVQREVYHAKEIARLIQQCKPTAVLDAGCASGLTSFLFAKAGVPTVGLDQSKTMLKVARGKFRGQSLPLSFRHGKFEALPKSMNGRFDLVVCLANSISGLLTVSLLHRAMKNFFAVTQPGGWLVLQALNYSAINEGEVKPIRVTNNDGIVYERFSERKGKSLSVYVTRTDLNQKQPLLEVFRHTFDNFTPTEIKKAVRSAGFKKLSIYGDLKLKKRFVRSSKDFVVVAQRTS